MYKCAGGGGGGGGGGQYSLYSAWGHSHSECHHYSNTWLLFITQSLGFKNEYGFAVAS